MANGDRSPSDPEEYVLRSGVRSGLKREFAFALKVQAELLPFSLSRTRSGAKRTKRSDSPGDPLLPESAGPPPVESAAEVPIVVEEAMVADAGPPENGSSVEDPVEIGDRDEERKMDPASPVVKPIIRYTRKGTPERLAAAPVASFPPLIEPVVPPEESMVETQMAVDESYASKAEIAPVENGFAAGDPIVIVGKDGPSAPEKPSRRFTRSALKVPEEPVAAAPPPPMHDNGSSMETPMVVEGNSLEKATRRFTMAALKSPSMEQEEPVGEALMVADASLPQKPIRRITRSTTKVRVEDSGSGDVGTTNSGSDGSVDIKGGSDTATGSLSSTPNKKMELKMSKKIALTKMPGNVRDLLATGLLEGLPVKYMLPNRKQVLLEGIVKGNNILCSCASCNWSKAVSAYNFELHAGSTKKHPSDFIFLENGNSLRDVVRACTKTPLDMLEAAIQNAIGPAPPEKPVSCQKCKDSFSTSRSGKFALLCDSCLDSELPPTTPGTSHGTASSKRLSKAVPVSGSSDSSSKNLSSNKKNSIGKLTRKDLGLHKLVFMNDILPEGTEIGYYVRGKRLLEGYIKDSGIFCRCCNTVVSPSQFEAHAGRASRRKPYNNIYTSNGVSLHELSVSLSKGRKLSSSENDDLCSICADGGNLLLCDLCPRAFHKECVGLSGIPKGDWYCQYCQNLHQRERSVAHNDNAKAAGRVDGVDPIEQIIKRCIRMVTTSDVDVGGCALCRLHHFSKSRFDNHTVLLCDQCEKEYHVGCLKEKNMADLKELPEGEWFCSADCHRIHTALQDLLLHGPEPLPVLDANIIKEKRERKGLDKDADVDISWRLLSGKTAEGDSKLLLSRAVAIFHESFDPIVDVTTGRDLIPSMVYGRTVRDQDYGGMYCAVLTVGSSVVSAGILRVLGSEVAELPLVATTRECQGLGYFQSLFSCIERLLGSLNVEHFVLPAADEAESIWTKKFGFSKITTDELHNYLKGARATVFQGTSTLHKPVGPAQGKQESR